MVAAEAVTLPALSATELVAKLDRKLEGERALIAFDGDGTLWTGDVAEDVFLHATSHELLKPAPQAELARVAREAGVADGGSSSAIAQRLFDAYLAGRYPELEVCEMMTWCFAGFTHEQVRELADQVLTRAGLGDRLNRSLEPVMAWAERRGVTRLVISASPRPIVEAAARRWNIAHDRIVAGTAATEGALFAPRLAQPIPYAGSKAVLGRAVLGGARWLAAFGDSGFDADMMLAADVGVAVRPKPSLHERASEISNLVVLDERA